MCPEAIIASNVAIAITVPAIGLVLILISREIAPEFGRLAMRTRRHLKRRQLLWRVPSI